MAQAASQRRMTIEEFLDWNPPGDTRYQLIHGSPVAMAPSLIAHQLLVARLMPLVQSRLRPPCFVISEAGLRHPQRNDSFFLADLAVSCETAAQDRQFLVAPTLIIEVLSPSTAEHDRTTKVPAYRAMPTVQEILLIHPRKHYAEVYRRMGELWITDLLVAGEAILRLDSVGLEAPLSLVHEGIELDQEV